jgi:hypothetical protein
MQHADGTLGSWSTVARETFEYSIIPWAGRKYAPWVRAWSRPHPGDPTGLVQVPEPIYNGFHARRPMQRLDRAGAEQLGYPSVPGERELDDVRRDLHLALERCDWARAHDLDMQLRLLQERVAQMRVQAVVPARGG